MSSQALPALPPGGPERNRLRRFRHWLLRRWTGRIVLASLAVVLLDVVGVPLPGPLTGPAWLVTAIACVVGMFRAAGYVLWRLLWRIRTKLILSYLFIAVVPVVLLLLFFGVAAVLSSGLLASYMLTTEIDRKADELRRAAETALGRLSQGATATTVEQAVAPARAVHPDLSYAFVRDGRVIGSSGSVPQELPSWWKEPSFVGLVRQGDKSWLRAVVSRPGAHLTVDAPLDQKLFAALEQRASIRMLAAGGTVRTKGGDVDIDFNEPSPRPGDRASPGAPVPEEHIDGLVFFATPDQTDWATGAREALPIAFRYDPIVLLRRMTPGTVDTGALLVQILAGLGAVFLVMYGVALAVGLLLARSITRSVHALSRGTDRLRQGRFDQQIPVHSRDQLGELADSFNLMARDVQQLMRESAEKERLEEELRIARRIQMSLLPEGTVTVPHVAIAAACLPAAEVGGDYYDLLPLPGDRLAVLVADVSGKGTSAALYMAELKGLMLSLSRVHDSPARLLAEANRILAGDIDSRSFITMSYAVVDPRGKRMRYARAGHSPLIQRVASTGATRVLAPSGLGLGLDGGDRFEQVLEEQEVPLASGDVFLFFTDGISEAMNARGELFGEDRLRRVLEQDAAPSSELVRQRVLDQVQAFVGEAPQHDDMTMVVLRID